MCAPTFPQVVEQGNKTFVWLGTFNRTPVIKELESAKQIALKEAEQRRQYRYVLPFKDGFLVLSHADLVGGFYAMKDDVVLKVDPPYAA